MRTASAEKDRLMLKALRDPEFRAKVVRLMGPRTGGCMEWRGTVDNRGYGRVKIPLRISPTNTPVRATRLVWTLINERVLPPAAVIAHSCDNPKCVNPNHLIATTQGWNTRDAYKKGRRVSPRGEKAATAKLTEAQVREIRSLEGVESQDSMAARFGVVQSVISAIICRKTWTHI